MKVLPRAKTLRRVVGSVLLALMIWCGMGPGSPAWALSLSDEKELGRKALQQVRALFPMVDDVELLAYVQSIVNRISKSLDRSPYEYQVFIINNDVPNAFAIPGGYVFIFRGLIDLMDDEDQLASILSHEIAHVEARHISRRIEESRIINIAAIAGVLAALFLGGGGNASSALAIGTLAGAQTLQLQYSRENEEEADRLGYGYYRSAGYNPKDMVSIMVSLSRTRLQPSSRGTSYLSSHPALEDRIHYLQQLVDKDPADKKKTTHNSSHGDFLLMKAMLISDYLDPHVAREKLVAMSRNKDLEAAASFGLARLDLRQNQAEKALNQFRQVILQYPNSPMVLGSMGAAYFHMGRLAEARKVLDSALMLGAKTVSIHFRLAIVLKDMGRTDEALEHLYQAERLAPMIPEINYQLGVVLGQKNDLGLAHYYLGTYYRQRKDIKTAIFHFEKARPLLAGVPAKRSEVDEAMRELKGEKAKEEREKADKKKGL
jgi:beta-barrel assembly-enhancing protease